MTNRGSKAMVGIPSGWEANVAFEAALYIPKWELCEMWDDLSHLISYSIKNNWNTHPETEC